MTQESTLYMSLGYSQFIVTYLFNTCHISILNNVARELRGKRRKLYLDQKILRRHGIINIEI
jgi:hypothetical protein